MDSVNDLSGDRRGEFACLRSAYRRRQKRRDYKCWQLWV